MACRGRKHPGIAAGGGLRAPAVHRAIEALAPQRADDVEGPAKRGTFMGIRDHHIPQARRRTGEIQLPAQGSAAGELKICRGNVRLAAARKLQGGGGAEARASHIDGNIPR